MRRLLLLLVLTFAALATVGGVPTTAAAPGTPAAASPEIVAVVPNPTTYGDRGEHLVVSFPPDTDVANWTVTDGETTVGIANDTLSGRVALAEDPAATRNLTRLPVVGVDGRLALANDGEEIKLLRAGLVVDRVRYDRAPEGEAYVRSDAGWEWRPIGATDLGVVTASEARVRVFVLPDAPDEPIAALGSANRRILLAAYTFSSARAVRSLCAARDREVGVEVAVDATPVGGVTRREAELLDDLVTCGVTVYALGGDGSRYAFYHAKYAVIDDRALVLTENWKPAGTGGRSSRGWGALVESPEVAGALATTFRADVDARDTIGWDEFRAGRSFVEGPPPATGEYPARFVPETVTASEIEVVVAPDNAETVVVDLLDAATESVLVEQVSVEADGPFFQALLRAARRGVTVRVLVSGAWYAEEENEALIERLREAADREGLPLEARVAAPRSRFSKIHAKGAVVDGDTVLLGSLNWNAASATENREVGLVIHGEAVARYYTETFQADWRGGVWSLPVGLVGAVAGGAVLATLTARRSIRFSV